MFYGIRSSIWFQVHMHPKFSVGSWAWVATEQSPGRVQEKETESLWDFIHFDVMWNTLMWRWSSPVLKPKRHVENLSALSHVHRFNFVIKQKLFEWSNSNFLVGLLKYCVYMLIYALIWVRLAMFSYAFISTPL